jgi:hypothetical protein
VCDHRHGAGLLLLLLLRGGPAGLLLLLLLLLVVHMLRLFCCLVPDDPETYFVRFNPLKPKLVKITCKYSFRTSKRASHFTVKKSNG